ASGALGRAAIAHEIDVPDLTDLEVDPDRVGDRVDGTNEDVDDVDDAVDSTLDDAQHLVPDRLGLVLDRVPGRDDLILQLRELRDERINDEVLDRVPDVIPDPVPHIGDLVADLLPNVSHLVPQGLEPWQQGVSDEAPDRIPDRLDDDVPRPPDGALDLVPGLLDNTPQGHAKRIAWPMKFQAMRTTSHSAKKPGMRNVVMNHFTSVKIGWMMLSHAQVMIAATALKTADTIVQMIWNAGITTD